MPNKWKYSVATAFAFSSKHIFHSSGSSSSSFFHDFLHFFSLHPFLLKLYCFLDVFVSFQTFCELAFSRTSSRALFYFSVITTIFWLSHLFFWLSLFLLLVRFVFLFLVGHLFAIIVLFFLSYAFVLSHFFKLNHKLRFSENLFVLFHISHKLLSFLGCSFTAFSAEFLNLSAEVSTS